ncbi:ATP-binding protein [uncultured Thiocystis sp.]|jgi:nitrogen fixation/metabolism regulation signal transduction histidine kinase|uniref:sensor histidine kinase n=1 Tax=uncultured Thiocystis sp. TaxID=1202134 RepID=UPI0025E4A91C|nr:ATP-binding protein [uncultured Thiocystis sp.]
MKLRELGILPVAGLIVGLFVVLVLMRDAVQNSEALSRAFVPLLFAVLAGLLVLAVLVAVNVVKLVRRHRRQAAGSRLTARIVTLFALISLLPVGVVYYFSLGFLLRGIDSWFDVKIGRAMQDALLLNQASLDLNQRVLGKYTEQLLAGIEDRSATAIALSLNHRRRQAGAIELTVYGPGGQVLGTANEDPTQLVPDHAEREIQQSVRAGNNYVGLESGPGDELVVRALVNDPGGREMQMQAIFPTSARISELSARLEDAYNRYTELAYLRQSLKFSFSLTLSLVLLFGLMAALIAAFHTARRLVAPVADIARGTRAIAAGDYEQQIPLPAHDDEITFLVASFNAMSRRIARARDDAARSKLAVETQRNYLETVLGRLSSGVVAFDESQCLRTANPAARNILTLSFAEEAGPTLERIEREQPCLTPWTETVRRHLAAGEAWRAEVILQRGESNQTLLCRGSPLPLPDSEQRGHVVVFDDITSLITAQRNAAWGEVARRLAHEIKNPLTPIQLSAERLRHKLLSKADEVDAKIIDRATSTIIAQVEAMKAMVNDFSDYARAPRIQQEPLILDQLIQEVLDLYRSAGTPALHIGLNAAGVQVRGDPLRLRQLIHNLIKNAQEALDGRANARIGVTTTVIDDLAPEASQRDAGAAIQLTVTDNGPGFEAHLLERLFEPYVTTKAKGTGLGLAIVKKIIEEHGGMIAAENTGEGALIRIRLPVWQAAPRTNQGLEQDKHP